MSIWERITDKHRNVALFLVVTHEDLPRNRRLVTWGRILGQGVWVDADRFHYYQPDEFTHAYIVPDFEA